MKKLLILFGGQSSEHDISRLSAASLIPYINKKELEYYTVGITKEGNWLLTEASIEDIESGQWESDPGNLPAFISPSRNMHGLQVIREGRTESLDIDCVFPVMHGELCEDGAIQGLLELSGIPYVGPNVCASACCMDKAVTKLVVEASNVRQADYFIISMHQWQTDAEKVIKQVEKSFGGEYPLFVKPASAGSSVGVSKAHNRFELVDAIECALKICNKVLVEETIVGREVEVSVLGNDDPKASAVGEIVAANDFYDFNAKYENSKSFTVIPANIPEDRAKKLREAAVKVYRCIGCQVMARVDFFLLPDGEIVFNEINTIPGFTKISMYPKLWEQSGISYSDLITKLCELAIERGCSIPK